MSAGDHQTKTLILNPLLDDLDYLLVSWHESNLLPLILQNRMSVPASAWEPGVIAVLVQVPRSLHMSQCMLMAPGGSDAIGFA